MTTSAAKANRNAEIVDRLEAEIERLRARLDMIAGIAEGSTTANSLPHIAKIARGLDEQSTREG
jgi:hypothetical protein